MLKARSICWVILSLHFWHRSTSSLKSNTLYIACAPLAGTTTVRNRFTLSYFTISQLTNKQKLHIWLFSANGFDHIYYGHWLTYLFLEFSIIKISKLLIMLAMQCIWRYMERLLPGRVNEVDDERCYTQDEDQHYLK